MNALKFVTHSSHRRQTLAAVIGTHAREGPPPAVETDSSQPKRASTRADPAGMTQSDSAVAVLARMRSRAAAAAALERHASRSAPDPLVSSHAFRSTL